MADFEGVPDFSGISAKKAKREYKYAMCQCCNKVASITTITIGYICSDCGKYNDANLAISNYDNNPEVIKESNAPTLIRVNEDKLNYTKFRDEHAIRADLYVKGVKRETVGAAAFKKILKQELVRNKCYRGEQSQC